MDAETLRVLTTSNKTASIAKSLEDPDMNVISNPLVVCQTEY